MSTGGLTPFGVEFRCPSCGKSLPATARFCGFCGTAIGGADQAASPANPDDLTKFCPQCSSVFPGYAVFCPAEGAQLKIMTEEHRRRVTGGRTTGIHQDSPAGDQDVLPLSELIGMTVAGKYRIEEYLGEGGMAVVYRAVHTGIERPVVIKVLQGRLVGNEKSVQRFERECKVTAKVSHPNVVSVFDVGFINGTQPYLVMEYIKGESLREKVDREGQLPLKVITEILMQVCRGLEEAHAIKIIHRDLKPENILLQERMDRPDWVKIVDFGIAHLASAGYQRLTKTGSVVGTAEYMAPEQLRDFPLDIRADLYALGVLLFEVLTAKMPFEADNTEALLLKILMDEPMAPSQFRPEIGAGSPFDRMVSKAMQKHPDKRYQSAAEMRVELEEVHHQLISGR